MYNVFAEGKVCVVRLIFLLVIIKNILVCKLFNSYRRFAAQILEHVKTQGSPTQVFVLQNPDRQATKFKFHARLQVCAQFLHALRNCT